jgi:hypothetical protein
MVAALSPAGAATFVVDTTSDSGAFGACTATAGDCSLRGAIALANLDAAADTISFAIPASDPGCATTTGVCRIAVAADFFVNQPLLIDGYTQPGSVPNTIPAPGANNAQLKIEITGIPGFNSFRLFEGNGALTLRGVAMFLPSGGMISGARPSFVLQGNWFGVTAAGTAPDYAGDGHVLNLGGCVASQVLIGGPAPADRNVIAGSGRDVNGLPGGGSATVCAASGTLSVQGNLIGLAPDGLTPLPLRDAFQLRTTSILPTPAIEFVDNRLVRPVRNFSGGFGGGMRFTTSNAMDQTARIQRNIFGLAVDGTRLGVERDHIFFDAGSAANAHRVLIGGLGAGEGNVFAAATAQISNSPSLGSVAFVQNGLPLSRIEFVGNTLLGNDGIALDFPHPTAGGGLAIGRTPNDPGDPDTGTNNLQNFPEISAFAVNGGQVELGYRVDTATSASVYPLRVDFYKALGDEGEVLIGSDSYPTASAQITRNTTLTPSSPMTADDVIVAIATDAEGRSSEFSFQPLQLTIEPPIPSNCSGNVHIFCDGFDSTGLPSLEVRVRATSSTFKPNGVVRVTNNRSAASCQITLRPTTTPLTSAGSCILVGAGAPGPITITATHDTLTGAFGSPTGQNIALSQPFTVIN